jgi:hypothetical protein
LTAVGVLLVLARFALGCASPPPPPIPVEPTPPAASSWTPGSGVIICGGRVYREVRQVWRRRDESVIWFLDGSATIDAAVCDTTGL